MSSVRHKLGERAFIGSIAIICRHARKEVIQHDMTY